MKSVMGGMSSQPARQAQPLPAKDKHLLPAVRAGLRVGMWCAFRGAENETAIGIILGVTADDMVQIDKVDEQGFTVTSLFVPKIHVRQATYEEIPDVRKPPESLAKSLGYIR